MRGSSTQMDRPAPFALLTYFLERRSVIFLNHWHLEIAKCFADNAGIRKNLNSNFLCSRCGIFAATATTTKTPSTSTGTVFLIGLTGPSHQPVLEKEIITQNLWIIWFYFQIAFVSSLPLGIPLVTVTNAVCFLSNTLNNSKYLFSSRESGWYQKNLVLNSALIFQTVWFHYDYSTILGINWKWTEATFVHVWGWNLQE